MFPLHLEFSRGFKSGGQRAWFFVVMVVMLVVEAAVARVGEHTYTVWPEGERGQYIINFFVYYEYLLVFSSRRYL